MHILACGIEVVDLVRFEQLLKEPKGDLAKRCFTSKELEKAGEGPAGLNGLPLVSLTARARHMPRLSP